MTAFFGFGATPHRQHGSPSERARSPLAPLCIGPSVCAATPSSRLSGHPADVGPEGYSPFLGHISCACAKPGTGPVLHYSRHLPQHTMPGSGRAPGPPAGPGSFLVTADRSSVFPSFGAPHPGKLLRSSSSMDPGPDEPERGQSMALSMPHGWRQRVSHAGRLTNRMVSARSCPWGRQSALLRGLGHH